MAGIVVETNDLYGWLQIQRDSALDMSEHGSSTLRERRYHRGRYDAFCVALAGYEYAQPGGADVGAAARRARELEAPSVV